VYERREHPPISQASFVRRVVLHVTAAAGLLLFSLLGGMAGYVYFEGLAWLDAFLNAAMLLGGMGPVNALNTEAGKLFAGLYALYAGLVFLVIVGLMFAPILHRILHKFHWDGDE